MTVSILGCGWYGKPLALALRAKGIVVKGSATSEEKTSALSDLGIDPYIIKFPDDEHSNDPAFFDCDVLVVSIPPKFRKGETDGFIPKIESIISAIKKHGIKKVIYNSSTAVYGDEQGGVTELDTPLPGDEQGQLLLQAERLFQNQPEFKCTILRFGGLVGPGRNPGKFFAGKKDVPNGSAPVNLIHLDDAVSIGLAIIEKGRYGDLFNACSPHHPTKGEFYRHAAEQTGLEVPEFIMGANVYKTVNSVNLGALLGYDFKVSDWFKAQF